MHVAPKVVGAVFQDMSCMCGLCEVMLYSQSCSGEETIIVCRGCMLIADVCFA